jgi:hypothetical protein
MEGRIEPMNDAATAIARPKLSQDRKARGDVGIVRSRSDADLELNRAMVLARHLAMAAQGGGR